VNLTAGIFVFALVPRAFAPLLLPLPLPLPLIPP
jgi:hypothetical protein